MHHHGGTTLAERLAAPDLPAQQQPQWTQHPAYYRTVRVLAGAAPLVTPAELAAVRDALAAVAAGEATVLQVGDCAESFYECTPSRTAEKLEVLDRLADRLADRAGRPVVRVGRIGGQFAKPRSSPVERHGDREIPSFRGHLVNSEVPTSAARQHDPRRILWAYEASNRVLGWVADHRALRLADGRHGEVLTGPWSSHEALVMDYERGQVHVDPATGVPYLGSTHVPWVGARTNQPDHAHVALLAEVANPVGCKIGPTATPQAVLRLCELLNPGRVPGRLVLIVRMGWQAVGTVLPPIVAAVRVAGHPVVWLSDPMHGNTVQAPSGLKTRHLRDVVAEAVAFRDILDRGGQHPGGLHLEVATTDVTECVGGPVPDEDRVPARYTSLCDPRLNPEQTLRLLEAWTE